MNAIISLCHFCELHGPSIMFCTQAFHSHEPRELLDEQDEQGEPASSFYYDGEMSRHTGESSGDTAGATLTPATTPTTPTTPAPSASKSEMCEACRSIPHGQTGFISNDHEAKVSYVSSQYPHHPEVFAMVRQACVRSLSCEVCPGREGPIFFGDDHRGHVLSHTFFIKDSQARGFQRWYSIIVVMMDKIYLLNSWPFLVSSLKDVITKLQGNASKFYEEEHVRCPPRAHRLTMNMTPSNFIQQRGGTKPARSISELTNDKNVFKKLHRSFTWILKAGGSRLSERLLEGPPTEDSVIDLEKQEETEEGFVKLYSTKDTMEGTSEEGQSAHIEEGEDDAPDTPSFTNLRQLLKVLGYRRFHELAHHVVIGNQIIVRSKQKKLVRSAIDCMKGLLPKGCCRVIYYSDTYEDSWRCNFLGMSPSSVLPEHATLYVTLDIVPPPPPEKDEFRPPPLDQFEGYIFIVKTPMQMPEKGPAVLSKMETALLNEKLADSVVDHGLICLKEEWMNKVKVLFKFTKAGGNRSDEDTRKLLQVVGAQEEDKAVLKFWMTGLSVQYRNHMLSSAIQQSVGF